MRHHIISLILLLATLQCFAQKDAKAREILDALASAYGKSAGTEIVFGGTVDGTIGLKGEKFVLECAGVKSWFDGKTLWSYIEDSEEVNISTPTPEELQSINPYAMLGIYKTGFNYSYAGTENVNGTTCKKVVLTPEKKQEIKEIAIAVDNRMRPVYIKIKNNSGEPQGFTVKGYKNVNLTDSYFKFNPKNYPGVEIIDLR